MAEISHDKRTHRRLFSGDYEYERFYKYLRFASKNTFMHLAEVYMDKLVELLDDMKQCDAAEWFEKTLTGSEGHYMLCHSGPGLSNCNSSAEVNWRVMKDGSLGDAGRRGSGYSLLRFHGNFGIWIKDNSKKTYADYVDRQILVSFPSGGIYSKMMYDKLQDFAANYIVSIESLDDNDSELKTLQRLISAGN